MDRDPANPILTPAIAPWLSEPSAQAVCRAIADAGHQVFYVGGCVRNALLGVTVSDVDLATSATPQQVLDLAAAAGLKAVPTGIEHGTITVVAGGTGYEVTTFRRDVETDGRHAVVSFSTDILDDARRRDFTMNALYADAAGHIVDPLGGLADLRARRVRFIEDADRRIREDHLRTLRFFRFHAWYGDDAEGLDPEALAAIGSNIAGLETLSAERIGAEMQKLLSAPEVSLALGAMAQIGVLQAVLPGADIRFALLVVDGAQTLGLPPDWIGRLAALGGDNPAERFRMSRADARVLERIREAVGGGATLAETAFRHGERVATQAYLNICAIAETPPDLAVPAKIANAAAQVFPVTARDLMPAYTGPALGAELARLERLWIASDFQLSKTKLLDMSDR